MPVTDEIAIFENSTEDYEYFREINRFLTSTDLSLKYEFSKKEILQINLKSFFTILQLFLPQPFCFVRCNQM